MTDRSRLPRPAQTGSRNWSSRLFCPGAPGNSTMKSAAGTICRSWFTWTSIAVCLLILSGAAASGVPAQVPGNQTAELDLASFDHVWKTIRDKHWDPSLGGLDWNAVYAELRPRAAQATSSSEARRVIREMLARLGLSHFAIIPAAVYGEMGIDGGDSAPGGGGTTGLDLRVIGDEVVVTSVDPDSPGAAAGVRPGWRIDRIQDRDLKPMLVQVRSLYASSTQQQLQLRQAIQSRLSGPPGAKLRVTFTDGAGRIRDLDLFLAKPRGHLARFGNVAPFHVWFESRRLDQRFGYLAFNAFMDPENLMREFEDAVRECFTCDGILLDLRGNPGGIGGMGLGMAGWFIDTPGRSLGTMITRQVPLNFAVNPRARTFDGPLAILVDGCSASTAEVLAGGLRDLGRAKVFGSRTAGAALPSVFEKLPNGDGFQYAIANYVSADGKPLEGAGVQPDVEVPLTRAGLLAGRDPVIEAALEWMKTLTIPR